MAEKMKLTIISKKEELLGFVGPLEIEALRVVFLNDNSEIIHNVELSNLGNKKSIKETLTTISEDIMNRTGYNPNCSGGNCD
tara:strand:- start:811 stop:1056 length:246 start_codon:yes stop_codon:yes gene_type:complete